MLNKKEVNCCCYHRYIKLLQLLSLLLVVRTRVVLVLGVGVGVGVVALLLVLVLVLVSLRCCTRVVVRRRNSDFRHTMMARYS